jgi:hypothetical protein
MNANVTRRKATYCSPAPWGFRWVFSTSDFDAILSEPILDFEIT